MKLPFKTNFGSLFDKTQKTILSAAFILAVSSGVNAFLGFLKGRLLASYFGISSDLTVFYTADRIPNLVYSVLIVGAVSTVFIPIFTSLVKKDKEEAYKTASSIINATFLFFIIIGTLVFIFAPQIIEVLALGKFSPEQVDLGSKLMRIMIGSQLLLVAGSLTTSVLQSLNYFLIPAIAPVAYNMGMILGVIFLSSRFGIYGPAIGVLVGSIMHFCVQIPLLKRTGFKLSFSLNFKNKDFRKMFSLIPPRILSVILANLIQTVNNSLAILVSQPSVVYLKFALQLQTFPVSFCGLSMASASLPTLSSQHDENNKFKETFTTAFLQTMFLAMPAGMILLILRVPAVRLVYGVARFPWEATVSTATALAFFSVSIFAQSANYLLTRSFYAMKDTKTPVIVSLITTVINIVLSVYFVTNLRLEVWAVAMAFSITSFMDTIILFFLLDKKVEGFDKKSIVVPFLKISSAAIIMAFMLYIPMKFLDNYVLDTAKTLNLIVLTAIAGVVGTGAYLLLTHLFKVKEIELFYKVLKKLNISVKAIKPENMAYSQKTETY